MIRKYPTDANGWVNAEEVEQKAKAIVGAISVAVQRKGYNELQASEGNPCDG